MTSIRSERRARLGVLLLILLVLGGTALGWWSGIRPRRPGEVVLELRGLAPDAGGWQPEILEVPAGRPVRLRIRADDVVHGIEIPGLGISIPELKPGQTVEVTFTATTPGRYPFLCTRWCSPDHWQMRGEIWVLPLPEPEPAPPPRFQTLNLDPDADWTAPAVPPATPSARRGAQIQALIPPELADPQAPWRYSPAQAVERLRIANPDLPEQALWDRIAALWLKGLEPYDLAEGERLFRRDCQACHGAQGRGDGIVASTLPKGPPPDWTDPQVLLGRPGAVLEGKILRGGMGTGMPAWGSLYTPDQVRSLVAFLWARIGGWDREP